MCCFGYFGDLGRQSLCRCMWCQSFADKHVTEISGSPVAYKGTSWNTSAHLSEARRIVRDSFNIFGMLGSIGL